MKNIFTFDENYPLLFTQFYFWAFFTFVFAGFALLQKKIALRNAFLCFISLFFYYKTSGLFVLALLFTTVVNFYQAKRLHQAKTEQQRKFHLITGLAVNLFFLCYFKYAYFFTDILNHLFGMDLHIFDAFAWIGNVLNGKQRFDVSSILLPVGISFYTFQNISYLMDIFRKRIQPVKEILNFGFYVCFFPQLVAGPIVRASEFVPQIYKPYHLGKKQFGLAIFWIINGLAKKIILSDYIAVNFVDRVFENPTMFSGFENLVALFGYSLQVYADFSGYTDIAIGVAMLMGFYLPKNFNSPYKATHPGEFWKRWHISLSKWLQDYLYIPMGGNRDSTFSTYLVIVTIAIIAIILSGNAWVGVIIFILTVVVSYLAYTYPETRKKINTNLNLMNTMLLGGLWHGASWNFVIWGGLNGMGIVIYKFWKDWNIYLRMFVLLPFALFFLFLNIIFSSPTLHIAFVWIFILCVGAFIRLTYIYLKEKWEWDDKSLSIQNIGTMWAVFQTFIFISFTRLFFRSGSNLNPSEANQTAWNTAQNMLNQIGGKWDNTLIGTIIYEYRFIFSLMIIGMLIHWLPEKIKRRYRLLFAQMSLPVMIGVIVAAIFIIYQFITADLQAFIYFQF